MSSTDASTPNAPYGLRRYATQTALVTRGTSGIGWAVAIRLADEGVKVWIGNLTGRALAAAEGQSALARIDLDATDERAVALADERILARDGQPDAVINCALDYASRIRVNCVCPGAVRTATIESVLPAGTDRETALVEYGLLHPLHRRLAEPEEITDAVRFLAPDNASLVTDVAMPVDAGLSPA